MHYFGSSREHKPDGFTAQDVALLLDKESWYKPEDEMPLVAAVVWMESKGIQDKNNLYPKLKVLVAIAETREGREYRECLSFSL